MTFNTGTQATVGGTGAESATANGINRKTWYVGSSAPSFTVDGETFPQNGMLWLDTTTTPPTPKIYNGTTWKTFDTEDNTLTLTNKTINATNNTITDTSTASDDLLKSNGTKFVRFAKGSNNNFLRVNNSGSLEYDEILGSELGRASLGANALSLTVSGLPAKKYLFVVVYMITTNTGQSLRFQFNSDTGANYSGRISSNNAADVTGTSQTSAQVVSMGQVTGMFFGRILNVLAKEKIIYGVWADDGGSAGAATAPTRSEGAGKWANTAAQITSITITTASSNMAAGTELVVYGTD